MVDCGLVSKQDLAATLEAIRPRLIRYPVPDAQVFERRVRRFVADDDT